jgi:tetratricopeptide (TPR) repeat protein
MTTRRWFCVVVLLAGLSGTGHAAAAASSAASSSSASAEKQARRSFERAEAHFKEGRFAEALVEYQAGYAAAPLPGFLINIAQCQRRLGDLDEARATYRKFVIVAPDSPYVSEVKALIVELDDLLIKAGKEGTAKEAKPAVALEPPPAVNLQPVQPVLSETNNPLVEVPAPAKVESGTRWWLWGSAGAVVVAGAVTAALLLRSPGTTTLHEGSLGTLRR